MHHHLRQQSKIVDKKAFVFGMESMVTMIVDDLDDGKGVVENFER